ncbi:hypothetical protein EHE19_009845 [Ruminiclostridium herbifermentans]|uniref:Uncharacterized protein n=1 Tax=Ruminiclostridium herbifermentans TaxID=2488810 RepID=A0A4V6EP48_9FIRM|nr:hypothetical protein [Ruminiclostridium herbifermentans]QNU68666.1 hypothetical protein EHE19_009845 [Ruminiclostridium herbifermentans]
MLEQLINSCLCDVAPPFRLPTRCGFLIFTLVIGVLAVIVIAWILINKAQKKNSSIQEVQQKAQKEQQ